MGRTGRTAVLGAALAISLSGVAGAQEDDQGSDEKVTMTIGVLQDLDSPNVTAGYLVSSFEVWNLQYATLTDKAADDFETIPGLAESWKGSADGLTWTYTLRDGLTWSDGTPLTAEDVAYTINRSRDEEWINHSATVANLDAEAVDDRTVQITSSVPDPKLPTMDVYIVPKHVYESISADDITTYDGLDGVGSGPFTLAEWKPGEFWRMEANDAYWQGKPAVDEVVFRVFTNPDAMVAALQQGEIDAAHDVPSSRFQELDDDEDIVGVIGQQGGFTELGMNAGDGLGDGHPALQDVRVRQAIARAIDRETLFKTVILEQGSLGVTISPSPDPVWQPEIPEDEQFTFDPDEANRLLDEAGYADTNGDGVREMPDGSRDLTFRYAERTESEIAAPLREFITGWLKEIGIATEVSQYDDTQLTDVIGRGEYDLFSWGWTPFVDPDPQLSYFTCAQVTTDAASPLYNDANWCNEDYDALYARQNVELDRDTRVGIVHDMLRLFYDEAPYLMLFQDADLQAYRTDRFEGYVRQPAEIGPVLFSNTSPSYMQLQPVQGGDEGGGLSTAAIIALALGALALVGGAAWLVTRRRSTAGERE